jgi:predicted Zn finger-like uncharacterized protein
MILTCPACQTRYQVDAAKFPPQGRNVRCARCSNVWHAAAEAEPAFEGIAEPAFEPPPREVYAQPEVRDPEPQEPAVEEETPPPRVTNPLPRGWLIKAGWVALAAVVIVIGVVATVYRHQVVETWPNSASVYSKLGMKVATSGLKIANTKNSKELKNGQLVLTVSGTLTNVADRELPVPQIRIGLVDNDKREVYHWTVAPEVITLKPGQSTRFVTQLSNPPDEATNYRVEFAKAGE